MRHNPNMYSQALEVAKQTVAGPIAPQPAVDRTSSLEDLPFDCQIGVEIDLGGLDGLVAQPNGDHGSVDAGLQQLHGGAVAENMGSHVFPRDRGAGLCCRGSIFPDEVLDGIGAETSAADAGEQELRSGFALVLEPSRQRRRRRLCERSTTFFSSFSFATNVRSRAEFDVHLAQPCHLRQSHAGLHGDQQEEVIPAPDPVLLAGRRQHCFHLRVGQEVDQRPDVALSGDGQHALDERGILRCLHRCVVEERPDRGQTQVAAACAIFPAGFEMIEEVSDKLGVQVAQHEIGRWAAQTLLCKHEEQSKRVPIGSKGVGTHPSLGNQSLGEEAFEQRSEVAGGIHRVPFQRRSRRSATAAISFGVARKYQYVSVTCTCPRYVESTGKRRSTGCPSSYQRCRVSMAKRCRKSCNRGPWLAPIFRMPIARETCQKTR